MRQCNEPLHWCLYYLPHKIGGDLSVQLVVKPQMSPRESDVSESHL